MFSHKVTIKVMKRFTTIVCCVCLMVLGVSLVIYDKNDKPLNSITAQPVLQWAPNVTGMPLDLRLNSEASTNRESFIRDSINIIDSVRIVDKVRWKIRYKNVADRTAAREVGMHPAAINPDSLPNASTIISTLDREEKTKEIVDVPKTSSIQLIVDGDVVYSKNVNHSTGESQ